MKTEGVWVDLNLFSTNNTLFVSGRSLSTQTGAHVSRSLRPLLLGSALVGYGVYKYVNSDLSPALFPALSAAGVPESQPSVRDAHVPQATPYMIQS